MDYPIQITVEDILKHHHFKHAKVIAGREGLARIVKWIHIVEVTQIGHLLNGNELILSTGVGWGTREETRVSFLRQLITHQVSGLCIELGTTFKQIPREMVKMANDNDFPLIIFEREVRFIDITQDLHRILIDNHYKRITELEKYYEQKRKEEEERWIRDWLSNSHSLETVQRYLKKNGYTHLFTGGTVCLIRLEYRYQTEQFHSSPITKRIAELASTGYVQQGFSFFTLNEDERIVHILLDKKEEVSWKERVKKGMQYWIEVLQSERKEVIRVHWIAGKRFKEINQLHASLQTAEEVFAIQENFDLDESYFYDDYHIYYLISLAEKSGILQNLVEYYLSSVIRYDNEKKGDLLETLKAYLLCNGSIQDTANRLYIVRQTMYHRLEKLKELLGHDFMLPRKRLMIEFAIYGYELMRRENISISEN